MIVSQVVAQALGLALGVGLIIVAGVQVLGPQVLVRLAGEKGKEVSVCLTCSITYNTHCEPDNYCVTVCSTLTMIPASSLL